MSIEFDVYCDESRHEALTSQAAGSTFTMIGGLWVPATARAELKRRVNEIRERHRAFGEIKWSKISPGKVGFYQELMELFCARDDLRFRCIAVRRDRVDLDYHDGDAELGFYKFYYQMLVKWLPPMMGATRCTYSIFADAKANRDPSRLKVLHDVLGTQVGAGTVRQVQALPSHEVAGLQLCDLLLGAVSARMNGSLATGGARETVVKVLEQRLGRRKLRATARTERKFNVFEIVPGAAW